MATRKILAAAPANSLRTTWYRYKYVEKRNWWKQNNIIRENVELLDSYRFVAKGRSGRGKIYMPFRVKPRLPFLIVSSLFSPLLFVFDTKWCESLRWHSISKTETHGLPEMERVLIVSCSRFFPYGPTEKVSHFRRRNARLAFGWWNSNCADSRRTNYY